MCSQGPDHGEISYQLMLGILICLVTETSIMMVSRPQHFFEGDRQNRVNRAVINDALDLGFR